MKPVTVADEILRELPVLMKRHPSGPSLKQIAEHMGIEIAHIRNAAKSLNTEALADLMRRVDSKEQFLVPFRYRKAQGLRYCANCNKTFPQSHVTRTVSGTHYSNRRCCSRSCGIAWSWTRPGVKVKRKAGISISKNTSHAMDRLADHNKRRWSKPEEHTKLSEQNRREWADPMKRALRAQAIASVHRTPEMRQFYSNLRKEWWKVPAMREKMIVAARKAKQTPEFRAYFSELLKARWRDPAWRRKWLPAVRKNIAKASKASVEKRKQNSEHPVHTG